MLTAVHRHVHKLAIATVGSQAHTASARLPFSSGRSVMPHDEQPSRQPGTRCGSAWRVMNGLRLHAVTSFRSASVRRRGQRGGPRSGASGRGPGGWRLRADGRPWNVRRAVVRMPTFRSSASRVMRAVLAADTPTGVMSAGQAAQLTGQAARRQRRNAGQRCLWCSRRRRARCPGRGAFICR
jgi:hypothetical protein